MAEPTTRPIVQLESPFADPVVTEHLANLAYARAALLDCLLRGEAPFASHLLYTQQGVLSDHNPQERALGIESGLAFLRAADKTVVYTDRGISSGMRQGIARAEELAIPVEYRTLPDWPDELRRR